MQCAASRLKRERRNGTLAARGGVYGSQKDKSEETQSKEVHPIEAEEENQGAQAGGAETGTPPKKETRARKS